MYLDAQLADGIRTNVTVYLATIHHEDTWVKNGYLQFDKLLFLGSDAVNDIMKYVTIDAGLVEVDYGDQHSVALMPAMACTIPSSITTSWTNSQPRQAQNSTTIIMASSDGRYHQWAA